jgi:transcription elongation factor GreA
VPKAEQELTQAAYDRLQAELDEKTTVGRKDIAERLQRARELGDLSENAEYHSVREQQGIMEARIREIQHILENATIVAVPTDTDKCVPGTIVTIRPKGGGEEDRYLFAASKQERAPDCLTVTTASPLGAALLGKAVGDVTSYEAPGGKFSVEVVKIEAWNG